MEKIKASFKLFTAVTAAFTLLALAVLPSKISAANVGMSLSSSASSVQVGSNFTVDVNLALGANTTLDAVALVNFDAAKIQYVSASYTPSSAWGSSGPEAGPGSGTYKVDVITSSSPQSGTLTLARITFKALADSGNSTISLSGASVSDGSAPPPATHSVSTSGTTVSFTSPPPAPQPASAPSTPTKTNTSNTANTSSSPAAAPGTNSPLPTQETVQANSELDDEQPVPVEAFDDGRGYLVEVLVLDSKGNPVKDATVTLDEQTSNTNENGIATFNSIQKGERTLKVLGVEETIQVSPGELAEAQKYTITVANTTSSFPVLPVLIGSAVAVLGVVAYLLYRKRRSGGKGSTPTGSNPVTISNSTPLEEKYSEILSPPEPIKPQTVISPDKTNEKSKNTPIS